MSNSDAGSVVSLWRYPVKSMMGEELNVSAVTEKGLLGDRAFALIDATDGKVGSAKNPRKWANLFDFRASYVTPPSGSEKLPAVSITFPDGTMISSNTDGLNHKLTEVVGRKVFLEKREAGQKELVETTFPSPWMDKPSLEEYWPDMEGLAHRDAVTDESMPEGTFFDYAVIHILTTATIDRLRALYPQGRFEVRRFRPNIVVATPLNIQGFIENEWEGKTLAIGEEVLIQVTGPCPRCVMTTLAQGDLPKDHGILRTAARHNQTHVGVYGRVLRGGTIRRNDILRVE